MSLQPYVFPFIFLNGFRSRVPVVSIALDRQVVERNVEITDPATDPELRHGDHSQREEHRSHSLFNTCLPAGNVLKHVERTTSTAAKFVRTVEFPSKGSKTRKALSGENGFSLHNPQTSPATALLRLPARSDGKRLFADNAFFQKLSFLLCLKDASLRAVNLNFSSCSVIAMALRAGLSNGNSISLHSTWRATKLLTVTVYKKFGAAILAVSDLLVFGVVSVSACRATVDGGRERGMSRKFGAAILARLAFHAFGFSNRRSIGGARSPKYRVSPSDQEGIAPSLFYLGGANV